MAMSVRSLRPRKAGPRTHWHRPSVVFVSFLPRHHVSRRFTWPRDDNVARVPVVDPNCAPVNGCREHVELHARVPHLVAARLPNVEPTCRIGTDAVDHDGAAGALRLA